jgi:hypothetical protein
MRFPFPRRAFPHLLLASLVLAGFVHTSDANPSYFHFEQGSASTEATMPPYLADDCEGVRRHFQANPVPVGAIDVEMGKEILGYEILCPDVAVAGGGSMAGGGPERIIPRPWGAIRVKYAP